MEINPKRFISYGLSLLLLVALSLALSSCTSKSSSSPANLPATVPSASSTPAPSTVPANSATPTAVPSPTASPSPSPSPTPQAPAPTITTSELPDGEVDTPYSQNLQATSGSGPYTWRLSADSLPTGLTLNSITGTISGTPTAAAIYFFNVMVTDSSGSNVNKVFSITIDFNPSATPPAAPTPISTPAPTPTSTSTSTPSTSAFSISTANLPSGTLGTSYSQGLSVSNGTGPFTWSYWDSPLPDGLKLDASTGIILGTPKASGTFNVTIQAEDSTGSIAQKTFSILINAQ